MSNPARNIDADPQVAAREWFVRLQDDDLTEIEIAEWERWIRADRAHQHAYDMVATLWSVIGQAGVERPRAREIVADDYYGDVSIRTWRRRPARLRLAWTASLAAAVLLSAGGWVVWERAGLEPLQRLSTGRAEHETVTLSDGSRVQMAAMTALDVRYRRGQRLVGLKGGEALFQVAHSRARPFVVETRQARITAVGTAFDVHVMSGQVAVDVTEGVVEIQPADPAAGPMRVTAGRRFLTDGKSIEVSALDSGPDGQPAWLGGRLEYRSQPLSMVLQDVNRYAQTTIVLGDEATGQLDFTGTVQLDAIEEWAVALPRVFPIRVDREPGRIVLTMRKPLS